MVEYLRYSPQDIRYTTRQANAVLVKRKFDELVRDLNVVKTRWEMSGNGNKGSGRDADDGDADKWVELGELDDRQNFLQDISPVTLYFWKLFAENKLLNSSLQVLNKEVSSSNGADGVPSVIASKKRSDSDDTAVPSVKSTKKSKNADAVKKDHAGLEKSIAAIGTSFLDAARLEATEREKDRAATMEMERMRLDRQRERDTLQALHANVNSLRTQKNELNDKLDDEEYSANPRAGRIKRLKEEIEDINMRIEVDEETIKRVEGRGGHAAGGV